MISTESDYRMTLSTLEQHRRPPRLLRTLMSKLESFREERRLGWSRPQNKRGVRTFCSLVPTSEVRDLMSESVYHLMWREELVDQSSLRFIEDVLIDPELMTFVFFHDVTEGDRRFEGVTLSFGRRTGKKKRHRDRIDVILESEVIGGVSHEFSRLRVFVDPFSETAGQKTSKCFDGGALPDGAESLFAKCVDLYGRWRNDPERIWSHWTQDYVEYFGPRIKRVVGSHFPTAVHRTELKGLRDS